MLAFGGNCVPGPCSDAFVTKFSVSTATPPPDFALTVSPENSAIAVGQSTVFELILTPIGGFNQSVSLGCSVQPAGPTCSISQASLTSTGLNSPIAAVQVRTSAASISPPVTTGFDDWTTLQNALRCALLTGLFAMVILVFFKRIGVQLRSPAPWIGVLTILFLAALLQACGGGSGGNGGGGGTNPGTYTITIKGTSTSVSRSATFTLTVN
jgi:hypothetical protein